MSKYRTAYAPEFRQQLIELVHGGRSANDPLCQTSCRLRFSAAGICQ